MMDYFILGGGWVIYFALHSLLASEALKEVARKILKVRFRFYRVFYNVIAIGGLLPLLSLNSKLQSPYYFEREGVVRYVSLVFITFGVMTIQLAFRQYGLKPFLGFVEEKSELRAEGILKRVRHPIYSGLILLTIGFFLFIPNLASVVTCGCIIAYLPIGICLEEKKLTNYFGKAYVDYKQEVPALIPKFADLFKD